jgi:hypothetical protein
MKLVEAERLLRTRQVWLKRDLVKLLGEDGPTLDQTLARLVRAGVLVREGHGLYAMPGATVPQVAADLRRGEYVYESFESALAQWGLLSQMPVDRTTYATSGRSGVFHTGLGVIDFTHTATPADVIVAHTIAREGDVPIADEWLATRQYRKSRRLL